VRTARQARLFVYFDTKLADAERDKVRLLRDAGAEPMIADCRFDGLNLEQVLVGLGGFGATHVLVEPGPTLARSFLARGELVDRLWVIHSPGEVHDKTAPAAANIPPEFQRTGELDLAGDRVVEYLNPGSPVFFAAEASADFVLAREAVDPGRR
jgi:riboflavin biosynthesis pyrimidine reductase